MAVVRRILLVGLLAVLLAGCGDSDPPLQPITYQHVPQAGVLSLGVAAAGQALHAVWVEDRPEGPQALHSRSTDGGKSWSNPVAIETGQPAPNRVRRSNDIRVATQGDALVVVWQTRGDGFGGSGPMVIARSDDAGRHWQAVETPPATTDDSPSHGFFALSATPGGRFHLAWLDNREGQQGLRHAASDNGGAQWSAAQTVVAATCQCCWNTLAHAEERTYLLYRAIDPRDMALAVRNGNNDWHLTGRIGAFDWHVDACPHVGGGLAVEQASPQRMHALVWTARDDQLGVHHLTGEPPGKNWQNVGRIGGRNARNTDLSASADGPVLAAWDQNDEDAAIYAAWSRQGRFAESVRLSPQGHRPSHPLALTTSDAGHVFWTARTPDAAITWFMTRVER